MISAFDAIDRKYRRKEIRLECEDCATTKDVSARYEGEQTAVLCDACFFARESESWAGY